MSLVKTSKILKNAQNNNKAVGAFNVLNLEMTKAVIEAAEEIKTPVIIQVTQGAFNWIGFEYLAPSIINVANNSKVDVAVHLDHSTNFELIKKAIDFKFSSVMYDGSHYSLERNIKESKEIIKLAKQNDVEVELEIGKIGGKEDDLISNNNDIITHNLALKFYEQTKPNFLAIAFGTSHGIYKKEINIDFKLLEKCSKSIPIPLVMHGTTGISFKDILKAIKFGISKVNVGTDLLISNFEAIRKYLKLNPEEYNIKKIHQAGIKKMKQKIKEYINLFNN